MNTNNTSLSNNSDNPEIEFTASARLKYSPPQIVRTMSINDETKNGGGLDLETNGGNIRQS